MFQPLKYYTLLFLLCCFVQPVHAMMLERPSIDVLPEKDWHIWSQVDSFDSRMDVFGYTTKFNPKAAKLNYVDTYRLGGLYVFPHNIQLSYALHYQQQQVTRSLEPKFIKTNTTAQHLRAQWQFYDKKTPSKSLSMALEMGVSYRKSPKIDFYRYDFTNFTVTWPGHALFSLEANDMTYLTAIRGQYVRNDWKLHAGVELRYVRVSSLMSSQNPNITAILKSQAPQARPWHEAHVLFQISADYDVNSNWQITADYQRYQINRQQYTPKKNAPDYRDNDTLDMYLFWRMNKSLTPYVHAHVSRRFMLGSMPLSYNQRSHPKFKYPFGYLSLGAHYAF
ncbi:MAG: hypothetical protein Q9M28_00785 [Mariprofundaceae bacterium]|nr:hypothetical protein [Mariprofundaceae bacterium]